MKSKIKTRKKSDHFNLVLPSLMREQLDRIAQQEGRTLGNLVRFILSQEFQRRSLKEANTLQAAAMGIGVTNGELQ